MDKANTCQRSQCECDKALAYDLSDKEYMWSLMNHRDWSIFDADTRCTVQEKEKFWRRRQALKHSGALTNNSIFLIRYGDTNYIMIFFLGDVCLITS